MLPPPVLPYFRSAASLALGLCWKAGAAAEVIGLPAGTIGERLYTAKIYLQTPDLFACPVRPAKALQNVEVHRREDHQSRDEQGQGPGIQPHQGQDDEGGHGHRLHRRHRRGQVRTAGHVDLSIPGLGQLQAEGLNHPVALCGMLGNAPHIHRTAQTVGRGLLQRPPHRHDGGHCRHPLPGAGDAPGRGVRGEILS